jgi:thioredoxin reductase (NADPH)
MSDGTGADGAAAEPESAAAGSGAEGASAAAPVQSDVAFPRLSEAQLAAVRAAGEPRELRAGETLFAPGDMDFDLVVVLSGRVAVLDGAGTPNERVVALHRARQFAGELNLITSEPAYLTAVVEEGGEGISLSREALRALVSRDQPLGDLILTALVARRSLLVETGSGVRLVGSGRSPRSRELREFLTRNRVPHSFTELEADPAGDALVRELAIAPADLPLLISGAHVLRNPTIIEAANALNLRHPNKTAKVAWDLVIVGGGPGGLGAAVYAATEGLRTILVDAIAVGGQASTSSRIENYLGFPAGVSGSDLADRAAVQARRFGLRTAVPERAEALVVEDGHYVVELDSGDALAGRTIVLATGASYRQLPLPEMDRFNGAGVYYAATHIEAQMCGGDPVAVVGGGNSAGQAAIFLSSQVSRVALLLRGPDLGAGMSQYLVDQVEAIDNIDVMLCTEVRELHGDASLDGITVEDNRDGASTRLDTCSLFVFIGADPCTEWLEGALTMDPDGFLLTGGDLQVTHLEAGASAGGRPPLPLETSLPGVFAVGDGRSGSIKRVASAVGEGSMAVRLVHEHLALLRAPAPVADPA